MRMGGVGWCSNDDGALLRIVCGGLVRPVLRWGRPGPAPPPPLAMARRARARRLPPLLSRAVEEEEEENVEAEAEVGGEATRGETGSQE